MELDSNLKMSKNKLLHLVVQGVRLCLHLDEVSRVLPLVKLQSIPSSPFYLVGLMNFKGKSIPIIDMALRLGIARNKKYTIYFPIVLCHYKDKCAGFVVDEVVGLSEIDHHSIQVNDDFNKEDSFFSGSIVENKEPALIVNMPYLLEMLATENLNNQPG